MEYTGGIRSRSALSVTLYSLRFYNRLPWLLVVRRVFTTEWFFTLWGSRTDWQTWICMLVLSIYPFPPSPSTSSHFRNNSSVYNEHLRKTLVTHTVTVNTSALLTPKSMRIKSYVERSTQQSYSYGLVGARVHTKTNSTSPPSIQTSHAWRPVYLLIYLVA
jgi:hypothetical protein